MSVKKSPENEWTKDGRKYFFYVTYKNAKGERKKYHSKKYFTKMDAYEAERTFVLSQNSQKVDTTITFRELYNLFYNFQEDKVKSSTKRNYKNKIVYLEPFMDKKIYELNIDLYMKWRNEMNHKNLSTRTKVDILKFFKSILNFGTRWYNYDFRDMYNKMIGFKKPDELPKEMDYYTLKEFVQFISYEKDLKYRCLFMCLYFCGLRMGELRGLTWEYIDFEKKTLRVVKNIVDVKDKNKSYVVTSPKTPKSRRTIPLSNCVVTGLLKYLEDCKKYYHFNKSWYVFGNIDPIGTSTVRGRNEKIAEAANLRKIRIHDFRHSCVSFLIDQGANITLVASYMGHTKIDETLNTYAHLYRNTLEGIVDKMDEKIKDFNIEI
jgi:integrase